MFKMNCRKKLPVNFKLYFNSTQEASNTTSYQWNTLQIDIMFSKEIIRETITLLGK